MEGERIRKEVGKPVQEDPLMRAWRLRQMVIELRGERPEDDDGDFVRKLVGRPRQTKG